MAASHGEYVRCNACGAVFVAAEGVCPTCGTSTAEPAQEGYHKLLTALLSASELERCQIMAYYPVIRSAGFLAYLAAQRDAVREALVASGQASLAPLVAERFSVVERSIVEGPAPPQTSPQWAEDADDWTQGVPDPYQVETTYPGTDSYDASTQFEDDSAGWPGGAYQNPDSGYYEPYTYDD